jgi:hypothetical protein
MQVSAGALVQAVPRDGLSVAADVAIVAAAVALVALAAVTGFFLLRLARVVSEIRVSVRQNLGPVSDRARAISDNVEFISQALRQDVERVHASVKSFTERLQLASDRMNERIEEFNALMEVVQEEAEDIFIDAASAVRGVKAGAQALASGRRAAREPDRDPSVAARALGEPDGTEVEALAAEEA